MTNSRFVPSAGLLLALAACSIEFTVAVPSTVESLTAHVSPWSPERTRDGDIPPGAEGPGNSEGVSGGSD